MKQVLDKVLGRADIAVVETRAKNCSEPFLIINKKRILFPASMTSNAMFSSIILYIFMK